MDERPRTILVVEDEPLIRMAISDFLQEVGFRVLEASNAADAIAMVESNNSVIDLVFSDVRMPGDLDGFGLSKWIRWNRPHLPVILASGHAKKLDAAHEMEAEDPFLTKPYNLEFVVAQIRQTIDNRKQREGRETG